MRQSSQRATVEVAPEIFRRRPSVAVRAATRRGGSVIGRLLLFVAVALGAACAQDDPAPPEVVRPVRAIQVPDPTPDVLPVFTGRARAAIRSQLSFEVGGRILQRHVDVGSTVEEGELLAALDPRDFENALKAAEAEAKESRALRDRMAEAHKVRAVSDQDLTDAESELDAAEATLRIRRKDLEDSRLVAPHAGEIAAAYVEEFQVVAPQQAIFRLLDTSRIEMVIDLPENRIELARYVTEVSVRFDAFPDEVIAATISAIGEEASATTRTYPVTLAMEQPDTVHIQAGMTGRATARPRLPDGQTSPPIRLPASAVLLAEDGAYVWVVDAEQGVAQRRAVKISTPNSQGVPVEDGLKVGEWIALSGTHKLKDGQKVKILDVLANEWRLPMPDERNVAAGDVTANPLDL